ncbi:hypothetical protein ACEWY4_020905 [Coilia grayii]|uniref:Cyclin-J-like protein n=1 Tax=Coilia grayii TaxID=363190 RepID=A0ABD1J7F4_9TELE
MELEGHWWKGQLAGDIHQALRLKELKLPVYKGQSPQLGLRRYFADLIAVVSNRFKLCPTARHLAVYLLDLFMDHYDITVQQLHIVALSCLLLASKFEEREDRVPKLQMLNSLGCMSSMSLALNRQGLLQMELLLLETFNWNLYLPTPAHFIEYYLSIAVHEEDLQDGWPLVCLDKTVLYMSKYADYFLEVSLQDHIFVSFAPSLVAAACVAASRIILRLSPTWPNRLQHLALYPWDHLLPCVDRLLVAHDSDLKEANKQKGQQHVASQPSPMAFHSQPQSITAQQHQYLQRPALQYAQQNRPQPGLAQVRGPSPYLGHGTALQPGGTTLTQGQAQAIATSLDAKGNLAARAYPLNVLYTCATPQFER